MYIHINAFPLTLLHYCPLLHNLNKVDNIELRMLDELTNMYNIGCLYLSA